MKIAIGKMGKSILFNPESWGAIGGDSDAPKFYENLFHRNPDTTFYLVGSSDFSRLPEKDQMRINKHGNIIDIWRQFPEWGKSYSGEGREKNIRYFEEWLNRDGVNIKFDCGLFFAGPTGTNNVVGKTTLMKNPDTFATPLDMLCKYAGPPILFLNETKIPYALIVTDPRYFPPNSKDWMHAPSVVLSQYNETVDFSSRKDYNDNTVVTTKCKGVYSAIETTFLIGLTKGDDAGTGLAATSSLLSFFETDDKPNDEKDIKFMIVCNEGSPSRYQQLKRNILDHVQDVAIYGKWDERTIGNDSRFKGPKPFNELQGMLRRVKYTYCIPIKKGWATSKFWEMAHYGVIPFIDETYDEQNNLHIPKFLRVKNAKDLYDKIAYLESNPESYQLLRDKIDALLRDEFYSGEYLNDITIKTVKELIRG